MTAARRPPAAGAWRRWSAAAGLSLAVHAAIGLAAVAFLRPGPPPTGRVALGSVEIVLVEPARPAPANEVPLPPPARAAAEPPPVAPALPDAAQAHRAPHRGSGPVSAPHVEASAAPATAPAGAAMLVPLPRRKPTPPGAQARRPAPQPLPRPRPGPAAKPRLAPPPALPLSAKAPPAPDGGRAEAPLPVAVPVAAARNPSVGVPDETARPAAGNRPPPYPRAARRRALEGRLVLRVAVRADGTPGAVEVLASSGHAVLDDAARRAASGWRFSPARRGGVPVGSRIDIPVRFRLRR